MFRPRRKPWWSNSGCTEGPRTDTLSRCCCTLIRSHRCPGQPRCMTMPLCWVPRRRPRLVTHTQPVPVRAAVHTGLHTYNKDSFRMSDPGFVLTKQKIYISIIANLLAHKKYLLSHSAITGYAPPVGGYIEFVKSWDKEHILEQWLWIRRVSESTFFHII